MDDTLLLGHSYDKVLTDNDRINFLFTFQDGSEFRDQTGFDPPAQFGNMNGTVRRDINYILSYDRTVSPTRLYTSRPATIASPRTSRTSPITTSRGTMLVFAAFRKWIPIQVS